MRARNSKINSTSIKNLLLKELNIETKIFQFRFQEELGAYVFIIFVVLQALFLIFIYKKVPETKNKSLEEISAMFRQQSYQ